MNGTLAIWYEPEQVHGTQPPQDGAPEQPRLEIHFNLWRDTPSKTNFLDMGLRLSDVHLLKRIYFYLPVPIGIAQVNDLSEVMTFAQTLDAVFNTVVEIGEETDLKYTTISNGEPFVTVHKVAVGTDVKVAPVEDGIKGPGCTLVFTEKICQRLRSAGKGDQYIRLRLHLIGASKSLFTQEIDGQGSIFVSSTQRLELTELRLNEQRSYPPSIRKKAQANPFKITRVHYFLIRELGHSLITQHAPLRKVRRLEAKLWASYLRGRAISTKQAAEEERLLSRLMIYHWKEGSPDDPIGDFTAFASFQASTPGLLFYMIGVVLLGAIGGVLGNWGEKYWGFGGSVAVWCVVLAALWLIAWSGLWTWLERKVAQLVRLSSRALR
ncbi:hypothetical protein [Rhizobium sp. NXC24]|uniref:hypothetical protein n=1 Tax=Rhizobium sp. NXC24 TaxID=2048897 RepID=UPI000CDF30F7|nr:hypothetical protein [Rhizobium sp. NXC24]AVA23955.1 hypothetical protein NXC24_PB00021 [Rhizobium sp. NXC24]